MAVVPAAALVARETRQMKSTYKREPIAVLLARAADEVEHFEGAAREGLDALERADLDTVGMRLYLTYCGLASIAAALRHESDRRRR